MNEVDKKMEGVNLEEKCLLLKSSDKEAAAEEEEKGGGDEKEKDGEQSTAVKLVGQVLSDGFRKFNFLAQVAGKKSTWKIVEKQFIQVWSSSGCSNLPNL